MGSEMCIRDRTSIDDNVATISTAIGNVTTSLDDIVDSIELVGSDVVEIKTKVGAIEGYVEDVDDGGLATISTDLGDIKADVSEIKGYFPVEVPPVDMTPVWIAVILSLVAAIAAIASVVQISRKIAG